MAEKVVTFVVGAGASSEFGLPTGAALQDAIKRFSTVSYQRNRPFIESEILNTCALQIANGKTGDTLALANGFKEINENILNAPSIDHFLHTHKDLPNIVQAGKLLIAHSIFEAEKSSTLYFDQFKSGAKLDFARRLSKKSVNPPRWTWLGELFRLLVSGRGFDSFLTALRKLNFVSFNYDRCIHQYILHAATSYFGLTEVQTKDVNTALNVVYPYGSLGPLVQQGRRFHGFGDGGNHHAVTQAASEIRTFTEGARRHDFTAQIEDIFSDSELVVFLGFFYLPLNLNLLFERKSYNVSRVLGTRKGHSEESAQIISNELFESLLAEKVSSGHVLGNRDICLSDITCSELFSKHHRYLLDLLVPERY